MRRHLAKGMALVAVVLIGIGAGSRSSGSEPPPSAVSLLQSRCTVCHSMDLVSQQRLDRSKWQAIVGKMVHWGAMLSEEEQAVVVEYLATRFHPTAAAGLAIDDRVEDAAEGKGTLSIGALPTHGLASNGRVGYGQHCLPCHGDGAVGGVGPKLAGNPILKDDERFWTTVLKGRGGMPAWSTLLAPQELADIRAWLNSV